VPAGILTEGISAQDHRLVVADLGSLPRFGGTVLLGRSELLHYTWSRGNTVLEMPRFFDPERGDREPRGLFRGRYGTQALAAEAGEVVIGFPFRFWDRQHDRADDPELAYFQMTHDLSAPVLFTEFYWQEEAVYPEVDLHGALRVDGTGSFAGIAERDPELYFTDGDDQDRAWQLFRQGTVLEARFSTVYRAGAFDPVDFMSYGWKTAPLVQAVLVGYEGGSWILEEVTGR
jgi:hypothetical protein